MYYISHMGHNPSDKSIMLKIFHHIVTDLVPFLEKYILLKSKWIAV